MKLIPHPEPNDKTRFLEGIGALRSAKEVIRSNATHSDKSSQESSSLVFLPKRTPNRPKLILLKGGKES